MIVAGTHGPAPERWRHPVPRWVAGWAVWTHPRSVVVLVLVMVALGFGSAAVTAVLVPVDRLDLIWFGVLAACAWAHLEATRGIERMRRTTGPDGKAPHLDLRSVWNFAALLLLPPALATAMVLFTWTYVWLRVRPGGQRRAAHRIVYSTATILLANQVATALLILAPGPFPGMPTGVIGVSLIVAAAVIRWLINYVLVVGVIILANPEARGVQALGPLSVQALEAGAVATSLAVALALIHQPILLPLLVLGLVVFHRCVLLNEFQDAARTDDKTGLLNSIAWTQIATQELARAERTNSSLGILMIDLDNFKEVNDTHGHPASDHVLRAVAKAFRSEVRDYDHIGRFGGDEFVIALPGVSGADLYSVAERLRHRVRELVVTVPHGRGPAAVTGLTASVGGAQFPHTTAAQDEPYPAATTMDELLRAADSACFQAKHAGRDRVEFTPKDLREHQLPVGTDDETS